MRSSRWWPGVVMAVSTYLLLRRRSRRQRGVDIVQKAPWHECIAAFSDLTTEFLESLPVRSASSNTQKDPAIDALYLSEDGMAFADIVAHIRTGVVPKLSAQRGPRYLAYVTGGATPVATFADWLVSTFDQSVKKHGCSIASRIERQTLLWLTELFTLPPTFQGTFTTGATAANFLALLSGRQFLGAQQNLDANLDGIADIQIKCFSASPHESMLKCLGFSGIGQRNLYRVDTVSAESECMDINALATALSLAGDEVGKLVIASAGTVSGTSFDDIYSIRQVCNRFGAWLHVDAAFGIYERLLSGPFGRTKYGVVSCYVCSVMFVPNKCRMFSFVVCFALRLSQGARARRQHCVGLPQMAECAVRLWCVLGARSAELTEQLQRRLSILQE